MHGLDLRRGSALRDAARRPFVVGAGDLMPDDKAADERLAALTGITLVALSHVAFDLVDAGVPVEVGVAFHDKGIAVRHNGRILIEQPMVERDTVRLREHLHRVSGVFLAEFFTGDVEKLSLAVNEGDQRRFVAEALDFDDVLQTVTVKSRLRGDQDLILLSFFQLIERQHVAVVLAEGDEFIEAAVGQKLHIRVFKAVAGSHKSFGGAVDREIEGNTLGEAADIIGGGLKGGVADTADHGKVRPDPAVQRFVKALLELGSEVSGAFGHRLYQSGKLAAKLGIHLDAVADHAFFDVVHDDLPVFLQIRHLAYVDAEKDREDKGHVFIGQGEAVDVVNVVAVVYVEQVFGGNGQNEGVGEAVLSRADLCDVAARHSVGQTFVRGGGEEHASAGLKALALLLQFLRAESERARPGVLHVCLQRSGRGGYVLRYAGRTRGTGESEDL